MKESSFELGELHFAKTLVVMDKREAMPRNPCDKTTSIARSKYMLQLSLNYEIPAPDIVLLRYGLLSPGLFILPPYSMLILLFIKLPEASSKLGLDL